MPWIVADIDGQREMIFTADASFGPPDVLVWPSGLRSKPSSLRATFAQLPTGCLETQLTQESERTLFEDPK